MEVQAPLSPAIALLGKLSLLEVDVVVIVAVVV